MRFPNFSSVDAFEVYLGRAKETSAKFKEGNCDTRGDESRIWRDVESDDVDADSTSGY